MNKVLSDPTYFRGISGLVTISILYIYMIVYDLHCPAGHQFEGWFNRSDDYVEQKANGLLSCPVCHSTDVSKRPSVSHLKAQVPAPDPQNDRTAKPDRQLATTKTIQALHRYVDQNFADVGNAFPEEARKIHYGEAEARNICGLATREEVAALREDGIEVYALPPKPTDKEKLH